MTSGATVSGVAAPPPPRAPPPPAAPPRPAHGRAARAPAGAAAGAPLRQLLQQPAGERPRAGGAPAAAGSAPPAAGSAPPAAAPAAPAEDRLLPLRRGRGGPAASDAPAAPLVRADAPGAAAPVDSRVLPLRRGRGGHRAASGQSQGAGAAPLGGAVGAAAPVDSRLLPLRRGRRGHDGAAGQSRGWEVLGAVPPIGHRMLRFRKRLAREEAAASAGSQAVGLPPRCPPLEPPDPGLYPEELARKEGRDVFFTMFDPERREWRDVRQFPIASRRINRVMTELPRFFSGEPRAREEVFEVELMSNTAGGALVCLKFHRPLQQAEDVAMAARLVEQLGLEAAVLRAKGQRLAATSVGPAGADGQDAAHAAAAAGGDLVETTRVGGHSFPQLLQETSFFQTNLQVNRAMQRWAVAQTLPSRWPPERDLLELFCGNGNFTLPLAGNFRAVLATELSHRSVAAAEACASSAGIANVSIRQMRAELVGSLDADEFDFGTLLVDPPRRGLDEHSLAVAGRMPSVIYVSCGPE
ncbi:unnamed protein product, partial [Prorocentrum cordatum]